MIETLVSVAISALVILAVSSMMTGAMRMSRSGSGHLTSLLAADIILQQLVVDLKQTVRITSDDAAHAGGSLELERLQKSADGAGHTLAMVSYALSPDGKGLSRHEKSGRAHVLFPDRLIAARFRKVAVPPENRIGMIVELKVSSPPDGAEMHIFKRFVYLDSLPGNRAAINSYSEPNLIFSK